MAEKIGNSSAVMTTLSHTDKNAYKKNMSDFIRTSFKVKPLNKIQQTKPQESRARKLETGIAFKVAKHTFVGGQR